MQGDPRDGTAAVIAGALVVTPPAPGGRPARVRAEPGIVLGPDAPAPGEPIEVLTAEELELELPPLEPQVAVEVVLAPDLLSATMRVERVPGARYRLEDQPPNREIVLRRLVHERLACPPPTPQELRATLVRHGVVHGIIGDSLARLVRGSASAEVVARGEAVRPARDGRLTPHALGDGEGVPPYVRAGSLLAVIEPADPGELGCDVRGSWLAAGTAQAAPVRAGEGVRPVEDGRMVAAVAGHAWMEDGAVVVRDPLVLCGDAADRVTTPGSLELTGYLPDLAVVRARGDILVHGGVRRATVEAGGSLVVLGPVVDSTLRAGHLQVAGQRAAPALAAVASDLQRLHAAIAQVLAASHQAGRPMPPARAVALAEARVAPDLEEGVRAVFAAIEREHGTVHGETAARLRDAVASLGDIRMGRRSTSTLASLARAFAEEATALGALDGPPLLSTSFVERSRLEVVGTLLVTGRGTLDSTLRVTGLLEADGDDVAIRGGELFIDGEARIAEASVLGGPLRIVLAPGTRLQVALAHAGVVVDAAGTEHHIHALTRGLVLEAGEMRAA